MVLATDTQRKYPNTKATIKKQVFLNDPEQLSPGDASDLRNATRLAKLAINRWGLGSFDEMIDRSQFSVNESDLQQEVSTWLKEAYDKAFALCKSKKATLQRISTALLNKQALHYTETQRLLTHKNTNVLH